MDYRYSSKEEVKKSRLNFFKKLNIFPANIIEMDQVHGTKTVVVGQRDRGEAIAKTDSLVTNQKNTYLLIKVADCLPIIFFDPKKQVIAVCHAGFLGTVEKIFFHTLFTMIKNFGCQLESIQVFIGPSICSQCFAIKKRFLSLLPEWEKFTRKKGGKVSIDFKAFAIENFKKIGIPQKNLHPINICTFENKDFYSHRRSTQKKQPEARFLTVVGLL